MIDTLKTTTAGTSAMIVTWMEWLPLVVRIAVGIATFVYLAIKIYKEIRH